MSYGARELAAAFRRVRSQTLRIAEDVPEERYGFRATPDTLSIGEILAHLAVSPGYQHHIHTSQATTVSAELLAGLRRRFGAEEAKLRSRKEIVAALKSGGESFACYLERLNETFLAELVSLRAGVSPSTKSRFEMLHHVKEHEIHHQGQLTVLERLIGIVPHTTREREQRKTGSAAPG